jgi:hypothetical protein
MTDALHIRFCDAMMREINSIFGYNAVQSRCSDAASTVKNGDLNGRRGNGRQFSRNA